MITNDTDYKSTIETLKTPINFTSIDISPRMTSYEENYNRKQIYDVLETLYDRIHMLEDVKQYCIDNTYNQINVMKKSLNSTLESITNNEDTQTDSERYINKEYTWSNFSVYDRDGSSIDKIDNSFIPDGYINIDLSNYNISHTSVSIPESIDIGKDYYIAEYYKTSTNALKDTINILLDKEYPINYISVDNVNSDIKIYCITSSGQSILVNNKSYFSTITISSVQIVCDITKYKTKSINVDTSKSYSINETVGDLAASNIAAQKDQATIDNYINTFNTVKLPLA